MKSFGIRRGERDTYLLTPSTPKGDRERANEIILPKLTLTEAQVQALGISDWDVGDKGTAKIQFEVIGIEKGDTDNYSDFSSQKNKKTKFTINLIGSDTAEESDEKIDDPPELDVKKTAAKPKPSRASAGEAKDLED